MNNQDDIGRAGRAAGSVVGRALAAAFAMVSAVALTGAPQVAAQGIGTGFQQYQGSVDEPIDIEADVLEVDDKAKFATFRGNVEARQGGFSLKSRELVVHYAGSAARDIAPTSATGDAGSAEPARPGGSIRRIEAKGKVIVATKDDQTATSDWANFDVVGQIITIGGNVVLSQGENVLRGDQLVIDLKSGKSRFEVQGDAGRQRIRGLFLPKQD